MIQAVIFDMDGLLVNTEPFWRKAEKKVFKRINIELTDSLLEPTVGYRIDEVVEYWRKKQPWEEPISNEEIVDDILDAMEYFIRTETTALEGVYKLLDFLKEKGIKMAIASSSSFRLINAVVEKLDIADYFEFVHSAEKEEYGKPHPQVYINTAIRLGVHEQNCLVFEDSFNGLLAAMSARMKTVAVPEDIHQGKPKFNVADRVLNSLLEFDEEMWESFQ